MPSLALSTIVLAPLLNRVHVEHADLLVCVVSEGEEGEACVVKFVAGPDYFHEVCG